MKKQTLAEILAEFGGPRYASSLLRVSESTVSRWVNGLSIPKTSRRALASILRMSEREIVEAQIRHLQQQKETL